MNSIELFHKSGKSAGVYACGECNIVRRTKAEADQCCSALLCPACHAEAPKHRIYCHDCQRRRDREKEAARFAAAEKIPEADYDGPVFHSDFHSDTEDFRDHCECNDHDIPEYVWACIVRPVACLTVGQVIDTLEEGFYEDFNPDDLAGQEALATALDAFNAANTAHKWWECDSKKAVILTKEEGAAS